VNTSPPLRISAAPPPPKSATIRLQLSTAQQAPRALAG
jgi:hypothetical protein